MLVTVEGHDLESLIAEVCSALRTAKQPLLMVIAYNGVPRRDLERVLDAARSLPKADDV